MEDSKQARMGEESSMEYDQERIFKHLCALFLGGVNYCMDFSKKNKQVFLLGHASKRS